MNFAKALPLLPVCLLGMALVGCSAGASNDDADESENAVNASAASNLIGKHYLVKGHFVTQGKGDYCTTSSTGWCDEPQFPLGPGSAEVTVTRTRVGRVDRGYYLGTYEKISGDVRIEYPSLDGSTKVVEAKDIDFKLVDNEYNPFRDEVSVNGASLYLTRGSKGTLDNATIESPEATTKLSTMVLFITESVAGPF